MKTGVDRETLSDNEEEETGVHTKRRGGGPENMTKDTREAPLYLLVWNEVLKFNGAQGDSRFVL